MRLRINAMAQEIDSRLSIHDLRCVPGPTHTNVIFDVRPSRFGDERRGPKARVGENGRIGISQVGRQKSLSTKTT